MDIKSEFRKQITLPYFNRDKRTILQTDASKKGFGAVILQHNKPLYFASQSLTSAECISQNLERECMSAIWRMEKFHFFLYRKEFLLQTDQKLLTAIFKKYLIDISLRIQCITIRAWPYIFIIEWIKGKEMKLLMDCKESPWLHLKIWIQG